LAILAGCVPAVAQTPNGGNSTDQRQDGKDLFERETFAGNGRTCLTCHTTETVTISPSDAQRRFAANPYDPLFLHDGSDDGRGNGATRIQKDGTILVEMMLPPNVTLADLPWHGIAVRLRLHTRRFFCSSLTCSRRVFTERLPGTAGRYARRTLRCDEALQILGLLVGGEPGA
jgi:hypothetical protein